MRSTRRAFTLLETLLAVAITAMTGLAMSAMLMGVVRGLDAVREGRSAVQRAHVLHSRMRSYFDSGLCVMQRDARSGDFALWLEDANDDDTPQISEARVFDWDYVADTVSVEYVQWPDDWTDLEKDAADLRITEADNIFTLMATMRSLGLTETALIADGVHSMRMMHQGFADPVQSPRFQMYALLSTVGNERIDALFVLALPEHQPAF